jgi:RNA polymerase sigma factor (sigma-70 family)
VKHQPHIERDKLLLEGLVSNKDNALEIIYLENFPVILRMILQHRGTEDDARDVFQDAMIVLFEKVQRGDFTLYSQLKTFLYSVCRHLWLKKMQGPQPVALLEGHEESPEIEDALEEKKRKDEQFHIMEKAMGSMGEPCKTILEEYYLQKRSMQEIAEKFGYTNAENAKNQKYKCLMRLKKMFFDQYKR